MKRVLFLQLFAVSALIAYSNGGTRCTFQHHYDDWVDVSEQIIKVFCDDPYYPHCFSVQCKVRGRWSRIARAGCLHDPNNERCAENAERSLAAEEGGIWSCICHMLFGEISPNTVPTKSSIGPMPSDATTTLAYFEFREPIDVDDDGQSIGIGLNVVVPTLLGCLVFAFGTFLY